MYHVVMHVTTHKFQKYILFVVVFITGAAVLIVEIVATRILSPYYGNTIYTVSSIIGIILVALSIGYYIGGRFADRHPSARWFYGIVLAGGVSIFLLGLLVLFFLPTFGYSFSIVNGPLIFSLLLFFLPGFLLGMLSPFAIKLQESYLPHKGIGSISGEIFFWSTCGSIFGSLFTGFFLIPAFGILHIIFFTGLVLVMVGTSGFVPGSIKKRIIVTLIIIITGGWFITWFILSHVTQVNSNVIYTNDGVYEKITVYDDIYQGKPTRFFMQDRSDSGAMFLHSDELVYNYTKYYALYEIFKSKIKEVLVIGGGAYSIPKKLLLTLPDVHVDVSEIEPSLFDLAKKFFRVLDDIRLVNYTEDGRRLLHDADKKYDLIFSDVYHSLFSVPAHFTTEEFFQIVLRKLNTDGVFIVNLIGNLSRQTPSFILSEIKTFESVFPSSYFFAVESPHSAYPQNMIFVGYNGNKKIDFMSEDIRQNKNKIISLLHEKVINRNRFELSAYPAFTDNFAPVDYVIASVLQKGITSDGVVFDGKEALALIAQQLRYGDRSIGTIGHDKMKQFLISEVQVLSDNVFIQDFTHISKTGNPFMLTNIIARFAPEKNNRMILATHYDSKKFVNTDVQSKDIIPGANDSASGVAVLLEIARFLANTNNAPDIGIDIVFFDGEEGEENVSSEKWAPLGSSYFAKHINDVYKNKMPIEGIVIDMICDKNLNIHKEKNSSIHAKIQMDQFWRIAQDYAPSVFHNDIKWDMQDDHTPLNAIGIPSFLIIDFDYKYFHTKNDTLDKCSFKSLRDIGNVLLKYVYTKK